MSYAGEYKDDAISFLKSAIGQAYKDDMFFGGRGPREYKNGHLLYRNFINQGDFDSFNGREEIRNTKTGEFLGFHEYWGMSLLI